MTMMCGERRDNSDFHNSGCGGRGEPQHDRDESKKDSERDLMGLREGGGHRQTGESEGGRGCEPERRLREFGI